ncbi:hypothetical protein GQX74_008674 [Glossina fuscipes]|nr:hypothetical protein GQX74_008674 [Glossina fuscipes]
MQRRFVVTIKAILQYFIVLVNRLVVLQVTYPNISASLPGKLIRGDKGERPARFIMSCRPGGACIGLNMVILRLGGARKPPDKVRWVRAPVEVEAVANDFVSIVSADFEIKIDDDCCKLNLLLVDVVSVSPPCDYVEIGGSLNILHSICDEHDTENHH